MKNSSSSKMTQSKKVKAAVYVNNKIHWFCLLLSSGCDELHWCSASRNAVKKEGPHCQHFV